MSSSSQPINLCNLIQHVRFLFLFLFSFFFLVLFLGTLFLDFVLYCNNNDEGILKKFLYSSSLIFCSEIFKTCF